MDRKKQNANIVRIMEIDQKIKGLQMEIMALERQRSRLDKARLNEMYEAEQLI